MMEVFGALHPCIAPEAMLIAPLVFNVRQRMNSWRIKNPPFPGRRIQELLMRLRINNCTAIAAYVGEDSPDHP